MIVEADFSPGNQARILRQAVQLRVMRFGRVLGFMRMNSGRGIDPVVLTPHTERGSEFLEFGAVANRQNVADARGARAFEHGVAIRVKVGNVHVRV